MSIIGIILFSIGIFGGFSDSETYEFTNQDASDLGAVLGVLSMFGMALSIVGVAHTGNSKRRKLFAASMHQNIDDLNRMYKNGLLNEDEYLNKMHQALKPEVGYTYSTSPPVPTR